MSEDADWHRGEPEGYWKRRLRRTIQDAKEAARWLILLPLATLGIGFILRLRLAGMGVTWEELWATLAWTIAPSLIVFVAILLYMHLWRVPGELAAADSSALSQAQEALADAKAEAAQVGQRNRQAIIKESRDALVECLLSAEKAIQKVTILTVVPDATIEHADDPEWTGWADELRPIVEDLRPDAEAGMEFVRVVSEHSAAMGIGARTTAQVIWTHMMTSSDVAKLALDLGDTADSSEEAKRLAESIRRIVRMANHSRRVLHDMRALVEADYRHTMGDDSLPFDGGTTLTWSGMDWLIPSKAFADYQKDDALWRREGSRSGEDAAESDLE